MKLENLSIAELECMPYDEIASMILEESGKKEKLLNLFKKICKLLNLDFEEEQEKMIDFFEVLSTNKKFVMLDNGYWDLQSNHKTEITLDHILEEELVEEEFAEEELEDEYEEEDEDIFDDENDNDDPDDDDLADLVVIDDEDEASL